MGQIMHEDDLQVFIDGAVRYFEQMCEQPATVNTPYLMENQQTVVRDYTGIIGISGKKKGCVYFTAPGNMLRYLLLSIGEEDTSHDSLCDLVGEVANTIAGNARRHFGKDFMISVPVVIDGQPERIKLPENLRSFIIPVTWRSYEAAIIISFE